MGGGQEIPQIDEYVVVVTGLGPFPDGRGGRYEENDNTSHLITQHLPSSIPTSSKLNPTGRKIRIINPTAAPGKYLKTEYADVRRRIAELWDEYGSQADLFLHLGMADGWDVYTVEERAYREGFSSSFWGPFDEQGYYLLEDDAGLTVTDMSEDEGKGIWDDYPMGLAPQLDVRRVVDVAQKAIDRIVDDGEVPADEKMVIQSHHDAGPYLCGFTYYESLAQARNRRPMPKVMFTHVPGWKDEKSLGRGAVAVCAIMGAICEQMDK